MKKKHKNKDPFASREAQRYQNPIPSREYIMEALSKRRKMIGFIDIFDLLKLKEDEHRIALKRRLGAMVRDGQLVRNQEGLYTLASKVDQITGKVFERRGGEGIVLPTDGGVSLHIPKRQMQHLYQGDIVRAAIAGVDAFGRKEAAIMEVLERQVQYVVGRYYIDNDGLVYVKPFNKRVAEVLIPKQHSKRAKDGDIVKVEIISFPRGFEDAVGRVVKIFSDEITPGIEIELAANTHGIPWQWPKDVKKQIAGMKTEVSTYAKRGRLDLRDLPLVTIDGEDAKDFDDAVYCEALPRGRFRLIVAIADVAHYVKPGTPLDKEAINRATSVYFPNKVIPMLPEILSNNLCSLKPHVDRLCLACEMHISPNGVVTQFKFHNAVMRSAARLTYNQVSDYLEGKSSILNRKYKDLAPAIDELYALYQVLIEQRKQRGAIDFDTVETRIVFGKDKRIKEIVPTERNEAHRIIEECMLCANVSAARFLGKYKMPALYRVHEPPSQEKLDNLRDFLSDFNIPLPKKKMEADVFNQILDKARKKKEFQLIQTVLLRSLMQASYTPKNIGHFGLAYTSYTHYTSPIRRYPDLITHRVIKHMCQQLAKDVKAKKITPAAPYDQLSQVYELGEHCSMAERRADEATRDATAWLKCQYMTSMVGEVFSGMITTVTNFGMFVELDDIYVDGLVHVTSLKDDYYQFDPIKHRLVGDLTNNTYRLGDSVRVRVIKVNVETRRIDFELEEMTTLNKKPKKKKRR